MALDPTKIHMGPATVSYGGVDLGYTLNDSVKVNISTETTPVTPDQASLPIMDVITNTTATVEVTFGQVTDVLEKLIGVEAGEDGAFKFKDPGGTDLKQASDTLVLTPYDINTGDDIIPSGITYTFPKACPTVTDGFQFAKTTPQGITITFKIYPDADGTFMSWKDNSASTEG